MSHYRKPHTAPRDGTIIVGLFELPDKRALSVLALFEVEAFRGVEQSSGRLPTVGDRFSQQHLARVANDPLHFFTPFNDEDWEECGRMIVWVHLSNPNRPSPITFFR
jgi:hypothetical protein